ncbi:hypothetical protein H2203_002807 [Taxawa tesnikishii (nom. ined.)]|nr:hypothetical protein H2203_002807 [Dothideales sp. JES 119]
MPSYDRYDRRRTRYGPAPGPSRSTLGYWVPLVLTITVATAGLVAWVWSERQEDEDEDRDDNYPSDEHEGPEYPPRHRKSHDQPPGYEAPPAHGPYTEPPYGSEGSRDATGEEASFMTRMSGAIRRTPSPQQFFDSAGQRIAAGEREGFSDHERWSEEALSRRVEAQSRESGAAVSANTEAFNASVRSGPSSTAAGKARARRTIAVVVSAETSLDTLHQEEDVSYHTEHASILSHLPQNLDPSTARLFVLIYAPHLTSLPSTNPSTRAPPSTLSSSYSAINTPLQTPGEELASISPRADASTSPSSPHSRLFDALCGQAQALVEKPSMILPFTTPTGFVHILRHLAPSLVYLADTPALSGNEGENVAQLRGWVGQTVLVVGDEGGHGGLVDTETETEDEGLRRESTKERQWWEGSDMVGLGKGVEVVDAGRVGDDWGRRASSKE